MPCQHMKIFFGIPESGPNVPDSPDFLIKFHKPVRIPDRIFPDLVINRDGIKSTKNHEKIKQKKAFKSLKKALKKH
jgi:hypothetical protein